MKGQQLDLFTSLNTLRDLKEAMNRAAAGCGRSRAQLVDRLNGLAERYGVRLMAGNGEKLTVDTLEKWLNPNDDERVIPLKAVSVFCAAVDSLEPLRALVAPLGGEVVGREDRLLLEWAREYHRARQARGRMRRIEQDLQ